MKKLLILFLMIMVLLPYSCEKEIDNFEKVELKSSTINSDFKIIGQKIQKININSDFYNTQEIKVLTNKVYGLAVDFDVKFNSENSYVKFILVDKKFNEYLIYETYYLLEDIGDFNFNDVCEETALLEGVEVYSIRIEIEDAKVKLNNVTYTEEIDSNINFEKVKKDNKFKQSVNKIEKINRNLKKTNQKWIAGITSVSELNYSEKKLLYGQSVFPQGFEFYSGGIISTSSSLKSATATSPYVKSWDWRDRHGKNWVTSIKNQKSCGSCWAFAAAGTTEAMTNLYFNQLLNLDLSEQVLISCGNSGDCGGGYPSSALNYIKNTGIVSESDFPYTATNGTCDIKGTSELIKITGYNSFGSSIYPKDEEVLKYMIINQGVISGGLYDWSHAMPIVGYKVVEEGDKFYYRDLSLSRYWITIGPNDRLIGKTVWIFKNSWGEYFGDKGYVYVETNISNIGWTHSIITPITSINNYNVVCEDRDGDGYLFWGLGKKPSGYDNYTSLPDGDDSNPNIGPIDEYGNVLILEGLPIANFTTNKNTISVNEFVYFNNTSVNETSWIWTFNGGNPSTSTQENPVVQYNMPGEYEAKLIVTNPNGNDTISTIITVVANKEYCYPVSIQPLQSQYISNVYIRNVLTNSSNWNGYTLYNKNLLMTGGIKYDISLSPFNTTNRVYWKVWIDYNGDKDFDDLGENIGYANYKRGLYKFSFTVPTNVTKGETRMRVSMKSNSLPASCEDNYTGEVEDYIINFN